MKLVLPIVILAAFFNLSAMGNLSTDTLVFEAEHPFEVKILENQQISFVTKPEIYLRIFRSPSGTFSLHANIDVSQVNQAILPTDKNGNIKKEALALGFRPFVKFRLSNGKEKTVDVKCTPKICNAIYNPFPYLPQDEKQSINVEVNIRGLQGKNWDLNLTRLHPLQGTFSDIPFVNDAVKPSNGLTSLRYYQKGLISPKNSESEVEPLSIDDWTFRPPLESGRAFVGPWVVPNKTIVELFQGEIQSLYTFDQKTAIRERLVSPQRFWIEPGLHVYFENTSANESRLRWMEFPEILPSKKAKKK